MSRAAYRGSVMTKLETPESDRIEILKGAAASLVLNLAYLLVSWGDRRILLLLFASTLAGIILMLTPRGGLGMGILLGAIVAVLIGLSLAGFAHWSPLD